MAHAPSPWNCTFADGGASGSGPHVYITDKDGRKIAAVWGKRGEKQRTASLMIAAPDMYAALKQSHEHVCSLRCPSVFKTGEQPTHGPECLAISSALAIAEDRVS